MSESALVTGEEQAENRQFVYIYLFNQILPTNPIIKDLDVGWRLALASKTTGFTKKVAITRRVISALTGNVKGFGVLLR